MMNILLRYNRAFLNYPIRHKLSALSIVVSTIAVLLTCVAFIVYDYISIRHGLLKEITLVTDIVGNRLASALSFDQRPAADKVLEDLRAKPSIIRACVYDRDKLLFAVFHRLEGSAYCPDIPKPQASY